MPTSLSSLTSQRCPRRRGGRDGAPHPLSPSLTHTHFLSLFLSHFPSLFLCRFPCLSLSPASLSFSRIPRCISAHHCLSFSPSLIPRKTRPANKIPKHPNRSTWTPDEDSKLLQLVTELGQGNWPNIAYHLPGRQPKQCRDRFVNKIDPNLRKGGWTSEEDKMIVAAHMRLGNRWHEMAKAIPGRSELQIKDRWYAVVQLKADMIAKDLTGAPSSPRNRH